MEHRFVEETKQVLTKDEYVDLYLPQLPNVAQLEERWASLPLVQIGFDSEAETRKHIMRVGELLLAGVRELCDRAVKHDLSKLSEAEKPFFDEETPKLRGLVFRSPGYEAATERLRPALEHHYANNSHHPQHYEDGIDEMDLFDLVEMMCDWKASGERSAGGNIMDSIAKNTEKFGISGQLQSILVNHAKRHLQ